MSALAYRETKLRSKLAKAPGLKAGKIASKRSTLLLREVAEVARENRRRPKIKNHGRSLLAARRGGLKMSL